MTNLHVLPEWQKEFVDYFLCLIYFLRWRVHQKCDLVSLPKMFLPSLSKKLVVSYIGMPFWWYHLPTVTLSLLISFGIFLSPAVNSKFCILRGLMKVVCKKEKGKKRFWGTFSPPIIYNPAKKFNFVQVSFQMWECSGLIETWDGGWCHCWPTTCCCYDGDGGFENYFLFFQENE